MLCTAFTAQRRGPLAHVAALVTLGLLFSGSASGQAVQKAFSACRTSKDMTVKVSACSFVIKASKDKSYVERAYNSRGLGYMALNEYRNAVSDFSSAISYDSKNSGYVDNRQGAFFALGDYEKALKDADLAVRMDPSQAFVYRSRGVIFNEIRQYDKAVQDFSTAIRLDPSWIELFVYRAVSLRSLGRTELSLADLNQAILSN
jgi:tetratricopeptide (TPR) repeat protein